MRASFFDSIAEREHIV